MEKNHKDELYKLLDGCVKNDRKSQKRLFEMQYGKLLPVCMRYVKDIDEAKDVLQVGFIKIFEKIHSFTKDGSLEGWMRRIVVNTAIDHIRKTKNDPLSMEDDYVKLQANQKAEEMDFSLDESMLKLKAKEAMEAIDQLTPAYKKVFCLYVLENYTHKEIAELLDVSEGTSKSNLAKAKQNLRAILEKKFEKYE